MQYWVIPFVSFLLIGKNFLFLNAKDSSAELAEQWTDNPNLYACPQCKKRIQRKIALCVYVEIGREEKVWGFFIVFYIFLVSNTQRKSKNVALKIK